MSRKSRKNEAFDLPSFQMIRAASNGDIEAINAVLKHYEGYIAALGYASNDIVLIILWILASIKDPGYIPVVVNFLIFFLNDMYGFICWKKRETAQC